MNPNLSLSMISRSLTLALLCLLVCPTVVSCRKTEAMPESMTSDEHLPSVERKDAPDPEHLANAALKRLFLDDVIIQSQIASNDCIGIELPRMIPMPDSRPVVPVVLWMDARTGAFVAPPGKEPSSLSLSDIAKILSDSHPYFRPEMLSKLTIESGPCVTFVELPTPEAQHLEPGWLCPSFVFRAWIDNATKTVFLGEVGQ